MESANSRERGGTERPITGLDLAYERVPASYDWMILRLNAMENRIQALMVLSASFLLTGPALVALAADGINLASWWFYLALATAVANLATGAAMRIWGDLRLPGPPDVDSGWLSAEAWEFKWSTIWWARIHFYENEKLVRWKGWSAILMTVAFLAETVFLTTWGIVQTTPAD